MDDFGSFLAEDLSYMSSMALRYFLPGIMVLSLQKPAAISPDGFWPLIQRIEGIFGCSPERSRKRPEVLVSYRPIHFTIQQCDAIRDWCAQVLIIIKKFHLTNEEADFRTRLQRLRKIIAKHDPIEDYDAELFGRDKTFQSSPRD